MSRTVRQTVRQTVRCLCALGMTLALAACSGGDAVPSLQLEVINAGRAAIAAKTAPKTTRPPLTRAVLNTLDGAFVEATLERRDQLAYLYVSAQRRDAHPGLITVWRAEDNGTLVMRNGVLVATQGLGGDILSSSVQVAGTAPGPSASGEKILTIRALDNKSVRLALACELSDLGPAPIEIIGQRHATRHLRETCEGGVAADQSGRAGQSGKVVYDYWVDPHNGVVWQSRQWAGPTIGYVRLRQLTQ